MEIEIKKGTLRDIGFLVEIRLTVLKEVFELSENYDMTDLEQENSRYYEKALTEETHIAALAFMGDEFVGCGGICIQDQMPSPDCTSGKYAFVMNMYTTPNHRGKGIAKHIVDWLIEEGRKKGVERFVLETTEKGQPVYKSAGFTYSSEFMVLSIDSNIIETTTLPRDLET